jgi:TRAP-type C4-dicarboxylate transport system permease small subunit
MRVFEVALKILSLLTYWISCVAISAIVCLTVVDVVLRKFGTPIDFAIELVILLAPIAIGFALPQTSAEGGHVNVDYLQNKLSPGRYRPVFVLTRFMGIVLFTAVGFYTIRFGARLLQVHQVTPVLQLPEFPVAYGLGACFLLEALVLLYAAFHKTDKEVQS